MTLCFLIFVPKMRSSITNKNSNNNNNNNNKRRKGLHFGSVSDFMIFVSEE